jgi:hypothetical protein
VVLVVVAAHLGAPNSAGSSELTPLYKIARQSTHIILVQCSSLRLNQIKNGRIQANWRFETLQVIKGQIPGTFAVNMVGGPVADETHSPKPPVDIEPGDQVVLFLYRDGSTGEFRFRSSLAVKGDSNGTRTVSLPGITLAFPLVHAFDDRPYDTRPAWAPLEDFLYSLARALPANSPVASSEGGAVDDPDWVIDTENGCLLWLPQPNPDVTVAWFGPCEDGKADGRGNLHWFLQGQRTGRFGGWLDKGHLYWGIYAFENGDRFQGSFRDGRFLVGNLAWTNGDRYEGPFQHNRMHGWGFYQFAEGGLYKGDFVNGEKHGFGICEDMESHRGPCEYRFDEFVRWLPY